MAALAIKFANDYFWIMVCGYLSQQTKNTILCVHVVPVPL